jgi:hypothetical protein
MYLRRQEVAGSIIALQVLQCRDASAESLAAAQTIKIRRESAGY